MLCRPSFSLSFCRWCVAECSDNGILLVSFRCIRHRLFVHRLCIILCMHVWYGMVWYGMEVEHVVSRARTHTCALLPQAVPGLMDPMPAKEKSQYHFFGAFSTTGFCYIFLSVRDKCLRGSGSHTKQATTTQPKHQRTELSSLANCLSLTTAISNLSYFC